MSYRIAGLGSQLAVVILAAMMLDGGQLLLIVLGLLLAWNVLLIVMHMVARHRPRPYIRSAAVQALVPLVLFVAVMVISS